MAGPYIYTYPMGAIAARLRQKVSDFKTTISHKMIKCMHFKKTFHMDNYLCGHFIGD